jgi:hypothetical protein
MSSPFDQAFRLSAAPVLDHWFGTTVSLKRDPHTSESFKANWTGQEHESIEHETGLEYTVRKRVYRFLKADAVLDGAEIRPKAGDELLDGTEVIRIVPFPGKPAVEEEQDHWLVRTDKLA